ncbi:MAG TPA: serpin family protein [Verrucomicrobiae bacterium]
MLSSISGSRPTAGAAQTQALVEGNTAFALDLYGQLKSGPGNLFFSPYSISTALAMVYAGARGDTEKQMDQVLHFGSEQRQVHSAFGELQNQLKEAGQQKGIELNIANALWAQQGHPFLPAFLNVAKDEYQASVNQADFRTGAEAARATVNQWAAEQTKEKIRDILPSGSVDASTRLVLANAIYFKGAWAKPYDKNQTSKQPFHRSATSLASAPLMHHFDNVRYMEDSQFQAVELPYRNGELSMLVLLPRQVEGCGNLEDRLTPALLSGVLARMTKRQVEIFFPRFKLESKFKLNDTLSRMGISDAFGSEADFSGIDGTRNLFISGVFHKAWGEVNEEGTEAAAATGVAVALTSAVSKPPPPPPVFRADHPFIFFIRDTRSGSLLFLGRLSDPSA